MEMNYKKFQGDKIVKTKVINVHCHQPSPQIELGMNKFGIQQQENIGLKSGGPTPNTTNDEITPALLR